MQQKVHQSNVGNAGFIGVERLGAVHHDEFPEVVSDLSQSSRLLLDLVAVGEPICGLDEEKAIGTTGECQTFIPFLPGYPQKNGMHHGPAPARYGIRTFARKRMPVAESGPKAAGERTARAAAPLGIAVQNVQNVQNARPRPSPLSAFYPFCAAELARKLLCPGASGLSPSISFRMRPTPRMVARSGSSATRTGNFIAVASRLSRPVRSAPPPERTIPRSAMPPASGSRHFVSSASRSALFASERPSAIR